MGAESAMGALQLQVSSVSFRGLAGPSYGPRRSPSMLNCFKFLFPPFFGLFNPNVLGLQNFTKSARAIHSVSDPNAFNLSLGWGQ
jgi:hypothetical protein